MNFDIGPSHSATSFLVDIRPEPPGRFTAQLVGAVDLHATAPTREEAVEQLRTLIRQRLNSGALVWVEVPRENPLMSRFGWARNDPTFGEYLDEIRKFREEVDRRENQASGSSECSDTSLTVLEDWSV
jgi:hypothetical protein